MAARSMAGAQFLIPAAPGTATVTMVMATVGTILTGGTVATLTAMVGIAGTDTVTSFGP